MGGCAFASLGPLLLATSSCCLVRLRCAGRRGNRGSVIGIGAGPRHACTVACTSTVCNGRERKKRGKCEIVPLFWWACVVFCQPSLAPSSPPAPLHKWRGGILHSPLWGEMERGPGALSPLKGERKAAAARSSPPAPLYTSLHCARSFLECPSP
jgi:hypothetical protein